MSARLHKRLNNQKLAKRGLDKSFVESAFFQERERWGEDFCDGSKAGNRLFRRPRQSRDT